MKKFFTLLLVVALGSFSAVGIGCGAKEEGEDKPAADAPAEDGDKPAEDAPAEGDDKKEE